MFNVALAKGAGAGVLTQTLALRVQELDAAAVPVAVGSEAAWDKALLAEWPARVAGPRPRRLYASLARARQQAKVKGGDYQPSPAGMLWRSWWAARG